MKYVYMAIMFAIIVVLCYKKKLSITKNKELLLVSSFFVLGIMVTTNSVVEGFVPPCPPDDINGDNQDEICIPANTPMWHGACNIVKESISQCINTKQECIDEIISESPWYYDYLQSNQNTCNHHSNNLPVGMGYN